MSTDLNKQCQHFIYTELLDIIQMELPRIYSIIDHEMEEIIFHKVQEWKKCKTGTLNELSDSIKSIKLDFNELLDTFQLKGWCNDIVGKICSSCQHKQYQYPDIDKLTKLIANTLINTITTITFQMIYGDMDITEVTDRFIEYLSRKMCFLGGVEEYISPTSTAGFMGTLFANTVNSMIAGGVVYSTYKTGYVPSKIRRKISDMELTNLVSRFYKFQFNNRHIPNQLASEIYTSLKDVLDIYFRILDV